MGFNVFFLIFLGFTRLIEFHWVLLGFNRFYWVLPGFY